MADASPAALSLDAAHAAVLVIECQNDLIHASRIGARGIGSALATAVREREVLANVRRVLDGARAAHVPILYANKETRPGMPVGDAPIYRMSRRNPILQEGTWGAAVHDDIAPLEDDHVVRRVLSIDASYGSDLFGLLRALGRRTIVAMGVSTNFAVEGTVRGAVNRGFGGVIAEDGCARAPSRRADGSCPSRRLRPSRTCGASRRRSGSAATS
jgi:nicotinamidase-related amidase